MADRVVVFIDAQNCLRSAHRVYCELFDPMRYAQFHPVKLGELLASRTRGSSEPQLHQVRVYTGRPDSTKQPESYAAHMRQTEAWRRAGAFVVPRTLRYPRDFGPGRPAQEKGIDVALSIDFVMGAVDEQYEVGIIFSTDSDLKPALEAVAMRFRGRPAAESAAWVGLGANRELRVDHAGVRTWCHRLDKADFQAVCDRTDYTLPG